MKNSFVKIKWGKQDLLYKAFSTKLLLFLMFVPFFKNSSFELIPHLSDIINIILTIESFFFVIINVISKKSSPFFKGMLIYFIWSIVIAPILGNNPPPSLYYMVEALGIISFIDIVFKTNIKKGLDVISLTFTLLIIINFFITIFFPSGLPLYSDSGNIYLFGLRTGFSLVIIPGIFFSLLYNNYIKKTGVSIRLLLCTFVGGISLINQWVVTGIIELVIMIILYLIFYKKNKKIININAIFTLILIVNFLLTFMGTSNNIISSIANFMNKDITLTGRTYIWEVSLNTINENPLYGVGLNNVVNINGILKPAHNHWLNIALESGYIGLIIMIISFILSIIQLSKNKKNEYFNAICIVIIATMIGSIAEIQNYFPFIYAIFEMPFLIKYLDKNLQEEEDIYA